MIIMNNSPQYLASRKGQLSIQEKIGAALLSIIDKCTLKHTCISQATDLLVGTQQKHDLSPGSLPYSRSPRETVTPSIPVSTSKAQTDYW